jgi:hypothetical protein
VEEEEEEEEEVEEEEAAVLVAPPRLARVQNPSPLTAAEGVVLRPQYRADLRP